MKIENIDWTLWTNVAVYVVKPLVVVGAILVSALMSSAMMA